eukprot:COSAG01_NODE_45362_length_410_cov_0.655949_2_plen_47_part_01
MLRSGPLNYGTAQVARHLDAGGQPSGGCCWTGHTDRVRTVGWGLRGE